MYSSALFLISALDDAGGQRHVPASINREEIPVSILRMQLWITRVSSVFT